MLKTTTEPVWGSELMVPRRIQAFAVFGMAKVATPSFPRTVTVEAGPVHPVGPVTVEAGPVHPVGPVTVEAAPVGPVGPEITEGLMTWAVGAKKSMPPSWLQASLA
jgi:hypothetical protein